jgi:glucokinase
MGGLAVGIDIGGTRVKLGWVEQSGRLLTRSEIATPVTATPAAVARAIAAAAGQLSAGDPPGGSPALPDRIGIGCAGLIDRRAGVVRTSPNLPTWREVPLAELVGRELGRPVHLLNDATAFVLAEAQLGAGRGSSPVVGLTLGTGVGGGIAAEGNIMGGARGFAGEIGHMSIAHDGPPCPCGNRGCLELYVGRRGIVAEYLRRAPWEPGTSAYERAGGDRRALSPRLLAAAAQDGETAAREAFAASGRMLGVGLANLANLLDPQLFVIGGGIAQAGDLILEPARRTLRERAMASGGEAVPVRPAALGVDAGLIGAGLHALSSGAAEVSS